MGIYIHEIQDPKLRSRIIAAAAEQNHPAVRPVEGNGSESTPIRSLDKIASEHKGGAGGVAIRVTCIAIRHRLLDAHDAVAFSMKPLTDAIAKTLNMDDADPCLKWEYGQIKTDGQEGVLVKIEIL